MRTHMMRQISWPLTQLNNLNSQVWTNLHQYLHKFQKQFIYHLPLLKNSYRSSFWAKFEPSKVIPPAETDNIFKVKPPQSEVMLPPPIQEVSLSNVDEVVQFISQEHHEET